MNRFCLTRLLCATVACLLCGVASARLTVPQIQRKATSELERLLRRHPDTRGDARVKKLLASDRGAYCLYERQMLELVRNGYPQTAIAPPYAVLRYATKNSLQEVLYSEDYLDKLALQYREERVRFLKAKGIPPVDLLEYNETFTRITIYTTPEVSYGPLQPTELSERLEREEREDRERAEAEARRERRRQRELMLTPPSHFHPPLTPKEKEEFQRQWPGRPIPF